MFELAVYADYCANFESLSARNRMQIRLVGTYFSDKNFIELKCSFIHLFIKNLSIHLFSMLVTFTDAWVTLSRSDSQTFFKNYATF